MDLSIIKILGILIIFIFTLILGLIVIYTNLFKYKKNLIIFINSFSGGLFLSISTIIILNSTHNNINYVLLKSNYNIKKFPWVFFTFVLSFIFIIILDKIIFSDDKNFNILNENENKEFLLKNKKIYSLNQKYVINKKSFPILVFIENLVEGLVLGLCVNMNDYLIIFFSILIHKIIECIIIRKCFSKLKLKKKFMIFIIIIYSIIFPFGKILGQYLLKKKFKILKNILLSFSAGIFFYLNTVYIIKNELSNLKNKWINLFLFISGFLINSFGLLIK